MTALLDILHCQLQTPGHADALRCESLSVPPPGPGQIRIRHTVIGVNFVDLYHRTGLYPLPALPATLGVEAAGVVESLGADVTTLHVGQRIAYAGPPVGAYAQARLLPAALAMAIPDEVSDEAVAAGLLRGITVHMLLTRVWALKPGQTVLVQAAAGGLGLVLTQWAKALGGRVIGTVGNRHKAAVALAHGVDIAVIRGEQDVVEAVHAFTGGLGVDLAVDGVGGATLEQSLACVRPFGMVASVGQASGTLPALSMQALGPARSIALSRPSVFRHMADAAHYRQSAEAVLARLKSGLRVPVAARMPLTEAAEAHRLLESGQTTGAVLLVP